MIGYIQKQLPDIVGIQIENDDLIGTFTPNQNHAAASRQGVVAGSGSRGIAAPSPMRELSKPQGRA